MLAIEAKNASRQGGDRSAQKRKNSFRFGVSVNSTYNMFQLSDLATQYLSTRPEGERCDGCHFVFNLTEVHILGKKFFCQHCLNDVSVTCGAT